MVCKKAESCSRFFQWEYWQEGIAFIHVDGEERSAGKGGYSNPMQIGAVVHITRLMLKAQGVTCEDIGVVTFYESQASALNRKFVEKEITDIKAVTVDAFQWKENDVIFLSTVRSNAKCNLCFFKNAKSSLCVADSWQARLVHSWKRCLLE